MKKTAAKHPKLFRFWGDRLVAAHSKHHAGKMLTEHYGREDARKYPFKVRPVGRRAKIMLSSDGGDTSEPYTPDECARFHYPGIVPEA